MHVVDRRLLLADLEGEHVADRNHTGETLVAHDREMADALRGHQGGAFFDGRVRSARSDGGGHDVGDFGRARLALLRDQAPQYIVLREDSHEPPALGHHETADAALAHELRRAQHRLARRHRDDLASLPGEDVLHGRHARYYRPAAAPASLIRFPGGAPMSPPRPLPPRLVLSIAQAKDPPASAASSSVPKPYSRRHSSGGGSMAQARINVGPFDAYARVVAGVLAPAGGLGGPGGLFPGAGVLSCV